MRRALEPLNQCHPSGLSWAWGPIASLATGCCALLVSQMPKTRKRHRYIFIPFTPTEARAENSVHRLARRRSARRHTAFDSPRAQRTAREKSHACGLSYRAHALERGLAPPADVRAGRRALGTAHVRRDFAHAGRACGHARERKCVGYLAGEPVLWPQSFTQCACSECRVPTVSGARAVSLLYPMVRIQVCSARWPCCGHAARSLVLCQ